MVCRGVMDLHGNGETAPVQAGFDRTHRDLEDVTELIVGEAHQVPHEDHGNGLFRKAMKGGEGTVQFVSLLGLSVRIAGRGQKVEIFVPDMVEASFGLPSPVLVDAEISCNLHGPGQKWISRCVAMQVGIDLQKNLLGQVFCIVSVPGELETYGKNGPGVSIHQGFPRCFIACQAPFYEDGIVHVTHHYARSGLRVPDS